MLLDHEAGDTSYKVVLYQHTAYVISLFNISIKNKFFKNKRVCIKINKFVTYSERDYILYMTWRYFFAVHSSMIRYIQFNHLQYHYIIIRQCLFWTNVDCTVVGNIENMPLEIIICRAFNSFKSRRLFWKSRWRTVSEAWLKNLCRRSVGRQGPQKL